MAAIVSTQITRGKKDALQESVDLTCESRTAGFGFQAGEVVF